MGRGRFGPLWGCGEGPDEEGSLEPASGLAPADVACSEPEAARGPRTGRRRPGRAARAKAARMGRDKRPRFRAGRARGLRAALSLFLTIFVFWNARGLIRKEPVLKGFLEAREAIYGGVTESFACGDDLSDSAWSWDAGKEYPPAPGGKPRLGMGAFMRKGAASSSFVRAGEFTMWHRVQLAGARPIFVGTGRFPGDSDMAGQARGHEELAAAVSEFGRQGHLLFGGDLNAHTQANGDQSPVDASGKLLLEQADALGLHVVNTLPGKCASLFSRHEVTRAREEKTTIDYVLCSGSLLPYVRSLVFWDDRLGSDHKPLILSLGGLTIAEGERSKLREVWRVGALRSPGSGPAYTRGDWSMVCAFQERFRGWLTQMKRVRAELDGMGTDAQMMADLFDWSFQAAIDEVCEQRIGKRVVGERAGPRMSAAARLLIDQQRLSEAALAEVTSGGSASAPVVRLARERFLADRRAASKALKLDRELRDLRLFVDIEEKEGATKQFWARVKELRGATKGGKAPPPVVLEGGTTESDPVRVAQVWRNFSAAIASTDFRQGSSEDGIYDDAHRDKVEAELAQLRKLRLPHPYLDRPLSEHEVFAALRKMSPGSAADEDGLLTDVLLAATDTVNTSELRGDNTVVSALTMMLNFILERGVWPRRWSKGVIVPLYKGSGTRLDPGNYRPIALLAVVGKVFAQCLNTRLLAFTEATDSIVDEQGGFRPDRGTVDQIFIFRELLTAREELGLSTFGLFVDVRKAYDVVWREGTYVDMHHKGIHGRVWNQMQVMHGSMTRKVRLPWGTSEPYDVLRGAAQGAVESPWFFNVFIDGLARAFREAGFGVPFAGRSLALLMYADDVVFLANSQAELVAMCAVATEYARTHRFQYNGSKCGVMLFNASAAERAAAEYVQWSLFGESVKVVTEYEYLGSVTSLDARDWRPHVRALLARATRSSNDLAWLCRAGRGMRPRTAMALWRAIVRPTLEYGCELWHDAVPASLAEECELVQTRFLRGVLGLGQKSGGVSVDFMRAELGVERLSARRAKLVMGFWRRANRADPRRALFAVLHHRVRQARSPNCVVLGSRSVVHHMHATLTEFGLEALWHDPVPCATMSAEVWRKRCYAAVDAKEDADRAVRMADLSSLHDYTAVKSWQVVTRERAAYSGEVGRRGLLVPEAYLDDRRSGRSAIHLKLLSRCRSLPLLARVGRMRGWPERFHACLRCKSGEPEDFTHFFLRCGAHADLTAHLHYSVAHLLHSQGFATSVTNYWALSPDARLRVLLGQHVGCPMVEEAIDLVTKSFLRKAWNRRAPLTELLRGLSAREPGEIAL